jgi:phosphoglycolate phosphatase-like HAD superfamily hydrolase
MGIKVAVAFDFDDTLGPDSTSGYLASMGVDVPDFWKSRVEERIQAGWDPVLAYMCEMISESQSRPVAHRFTKQSMVAWGAHVKLYPGVRPMFRELAAAAHAANPAAEIQFFLISSGLAPILDNTPIRSHFADAWACDFGYGDDGEILFPKNVVSFTDKTRYIFQIEKGIFGPGSRKDPFEVNRKIEPSQRNVPMSQMLYVGDGFTDVPCFSLLQKNGGYAVGVYDKSDRKKWGRAWGFVETGRVNNLMAADYRKNGPVRSNLTVAVTGIITTAAARQATYQG